MPGLSPTEIASVDKSNMLADVLDLPAQVEDALWRVESSGVEKALERQPSLAPVFVCGMGGSAIGGDLAVGALGDRLTRPLHSIRGYELPSWATPDSVVLCASYSGDTEETLACFEAAGALGATRVVVSSGGKLSEVARAESVPVIPLPGVFLPRAAVAYMLISAIEVAVFAGAAPPLGPEIDSASTNLKALVERWGPQSDTDNLAKQIAEAAHETTVAIYGSGPTSPVAERWKTQINENAKLPATAGELPEADHNEVLGWEGAETLGTYTAVMLEDADQHPRMRERIALTAGLIESHAKSVVRVESLGANRIERQLSLVLLGDIVSVYMAVLRDVDPSPMDAIDRLKADLAGN